MPHWNKPSVSRIFQLIRDSLSSSRAEVVLRFQLVNWLIVCVISYGTAQCEMSEILRIANAIGNAAAQSSAMTQNARGPRAP